LAEGAGRESRQTGKTDGNDNEVKRPMRIGALYSFNFPLSLYPFNSEYREERSPIDFMQITQLVGRSYPLAAE